jgi:hypothetical protein
MLTIFSTPKPFRGHINIIQRNAIKSWKLLHPDVEIILIGDDDGAAELCREFGIRHEPRVRRNPSGAVYLDEILDRGQRLASHPVTCYVNCDIILMSDFKDAVSRVASSHSRFLIIGRRWDTDITEPWDFSQPTWEVGLRSIVSECGLLSGGHSSDYFVFPRGIYDRTPPMVIARCWWDNWLIWKAKSIGAAVVDATREVVAIHQNHDYSYHPDGILGTLWGEDSMENRRLAGGKWHLYTLDEATHKLTPKGVRYNWRHSLGPVERNLWRPVWRHLWLSLLDVTRPIRHLLGLRQGMLVRPRK